MSKKAIKNDQGKPTWHLLPLYLLVGVIRVFEFGAKKYAEKGYLKGGGLEPKRVLNSLLRHFIALQSGEENDQESGLAHIDHIIANAVMYKEIRNHQKQKKDGS